MSERLNKMPNTGKLSWRMLENGEAEAELGVDKVTQTNTETQIKEIVLSQLCGA